MMSLQLLLLALPSVRSTDQTEFACLSQSQICSLAQGAKRTRQTMLRSPAEHLANIGDFNSYLVEIQYAYFREIVSEGALPPRFNVMQNVSLSIFK